MSWSIIARLPVGIFQKQDIALGAGSVVLAVALFVAPPASAALVTGWGLETGQTNGSLTEGAPGSFTVSNVTGNAAPRALFPAIDFSEVGDKVRLSGFATFANTLGNIQFRYGLFDTNSQPTGTLSGGVWSGATTSGWKGDFASPGNDGGTDVLVALDGGAWFSLFGGNDTIASFSASSDPAGNVEYAFSVTLTRLSASDVEVDYSFVGGAENRSGSFIDSGAGSTTNRTSVGTLNAIGFLTNTNTGASSFRDVDVSLIPEPSSLVMALAFALAGIIEPRRRPRLLD